MTDRRVDDGVGRPEEQRYVSTSIFVKAARTTTPTTTSTRYRDIVSRPSTVVKSSKSSTSSSQPDLSDVARNDATPTAGRSSRTKFGRAFDRMRARLSRLQLPLRIRSTSLHSVVETSTKLNDDDDDGGGDKIGKRKLAVDELTGSTPGRSRSSDFRSVSDVRFQDSEDDEPSRRTAVAVSSSTRSRSRPAVIPTSSADDDVRERPRVPAPDLPHPPAVPPRTGRSSSDGPVNVHRAPAVPPPLPPPTTTRSDRPTTSGRQTDSPDDDAGEYTYVSDALVHRTLARELSALSREVWYWGPMSHFDAAHVLSTQPVGTFIVRQSGHEQFVISLSFRSVHGPLHVRIVHQDGKFVFEGRIGHVSGGSVNELIKRCVEQPVVGYSRATPGLVAVQLTRPLSRFAVVRSLQTICHFAIRRYVSSPERLDELPLPVSVVRWLQQDQC